MKKLKRFLKENEVNAKFYEFSEPTLTVEDSARQLEVKPEKIVKSLVFKDQENNPLLAIVSGNKEVDENKLSKVQESGIQMAKAREVEQFTGYKVGEVPPINHGLKTYMDEKILNFDTVIAGGGSTHTLIEIDPYDIKQITDAELADIST